MSYLVSFLNVAIVMAHSALRGRSRVHDVLLSGVEIRRGWLAISHMLALNVLSQSDLVITLTYSIFMSSLPLGVFCTRRIKCLPLQHYSSRRIILQYVSPCVLQSIQAVRYTSAVFLMLRTRYNQ
jgi:hypothetical protein